MASRMRGRSVTSKPRGFVKPTVPVEQRGRQSWILVSKIISDPAYQRPVDMSRVRYMAVNFNADALTSITVSKRADGTYAALDGFHRTTLMRYMGWEDQKIPAMIFEDLTLAEEAELFRIINQDRTKPKPLALFKAQVTSGDHDAVALAEVFDKLGLVYDTYTVSKGAVKAIDTIQKVQSICGLTVVRKTLTIMTQAWGNDSEALNGEVFKGIALLLHTHGTKVDVNTAAARFKDHTVASIRNRARQLKDINPDWQAPSCMAAILVNAYNYRMRAENRLPAWDGAGFPRKVLGRNPSGANKKA